jgi:hypothetical protein
MGFWALPAFAAGSLIYRSLPAFAAGILTIHTELLQIGIWALPAFAAGNS